MNKNVETSNETQTPKLDISDVRQRFIGKYCYERYRYRKTKDGEIIKQGMGLEGVIKAIRRHKYTKELIVEFDVPSSYCYCQLEWVTTDETLKRCGNSAKCCLTLSVSFSKGLRGSSCRNTPTLERITDLAKLHEHPY